MPINNESLESSTGDAAVTDVDIASSLPAGTNNIGKVSILAGDSPSIDAFGRWRVSNPQTLFDSKNIFNDDGLADNVENQPLFYDNQETAGGSTGTCDADAQAAQKQWPNQAGCSSRPSIQGDLVRCSHSRITGLHDGGSRMCGSLLHESSEPGREMAFVLLAAALIRERYKLQCLAAEITRAEEALEV